MSGGYLWSPHGDGVYLSHRCYLRNAMIDGPVCVRLEIHNESAIIPKVFSRSNQPKIKFINNINFDGGFYSISVVFRTKRCV